MSTFDIDDTILSQYGASERIKRLLRGFHELIKPDADIKLFYDNVFNILTAKGVGLDVWGLIIGISREIQAATASTKASFFGFRGSGYDVFGSSPFYNTQSGGGTITLADDAYRELLLIKAAANISRTDLSSLISLFERLYNNRGDFYIIEAGTMQLNYIFGFYLEPFELSLILHSGLLPKPAGVSYTVYQVDVANTFGFNGSGMQPFNQGVFNPLGGQ